jgi:hypothetical protein
VLERIIKLYYKFKKNQTFYNIISINLNISSMNIKRNFNQFKKYEQSPHVYNVKVSSTDNSK